MLNVQHQGGGALPDLHTLGERLKVFWILADEAHRNPNGLLSSYAIAQRLELTHRVHVPRHRIDALLRKEKNTVLRRLRGKTEYWKLMRAGELSYSRLATLQLLSTQAARLRHAGVSTKFFLNCEDTCASAIPTWIQQYLIALLLVLKRLQSPCSPQTSRA